MTEKRKLLVCGLCGLLLCGCTRGAAEPVTIRHETYTRAAYETVEVRQGDLTPELSLTLEPDARKVTSYDAKYTGMVVGEVAVRVGDPVEKGQVLLTFDAGDVRSRIEGYRETIEENKLLIEHYTRLNGLGEDYSTDIAQMKRDNEVAGLYIEEATQSLKDYQLVAKRDGVITEVNVAAGTEPIADTENLIREVSGSGRYATQTKDDYPFVVGEHYTAVFSNLDFTLALVSEEQLSTGFRQLIFEPVSEEELLPEDQNLTLTIPKETRKNVVYVEARAVSGTDGKFYVYVMSENGYRKAREVTLGEIVDDYAIITEGLSAGEAVTVDE